MTVRAYSSFDTGSGAPGVLANSAGTLITLLDKCLVDGWTGTTPAGWSKVYSGTNKAVYRAPLGNRFYLRVDDSNANYAAVTMYETMSDVDTGTGKAPTAAHVSAGTVYWLKSSHSSAIWYLVADEKFVMFHTQYDTNFDWRNGTGGWFGDTVPYLSFDQYATLLHGEASTSASSSSWVCSTSNNGAGSWLMHPWHGLWTGATPVLRAPASPMYTANESDNYTNIFTTTPHHTGRTLISPLVLYDGVSAGYTPRARVPGVWLVHGNASFYQYKMQSLFYGAGDMSGRIFRGVGVVSSSYLLLEVSDTWYR